MLQRLVSQDGEVLNLIVLNGHGHVVLDGVTTTIPASELSGQWFDQHAGAEPATQEQVDAYLAEHGKGQEDATGA
jgi:hypothetical protein